MLDKVSKFICASTLLLGLTACSQSADKQAQKEFEHVETQGIKTITGKHYIAIGAPLTGPYKQLGKSIYEGANLAIEEFNKTLKNPSRHRIGTIIIDDGGLVSEGLSRAEIVVAQEALGVIGHLNSAVSIEVSKVYAAAHIASISPASTHPKYTERPETRAYVFRTIGTDRQLGEAAADYVKANPAKRIAVLYNDRPYGISVASEFVRNIARHPDKDVVFYETIPVRTADHSATVAKVVEAGAELVFFVGEYNDAGYLVKELHQNLPKSQFLAAEGVYNPEFIAIAGKAAEGTVVIGPQQASVDLETAYQERYKQETSGYIATAYNATKIMLEAIKANQFKDTSAIATTIAEHEAFDPNGDLIRPNFVFYTVMDSKFVATPSIN